MFFLKSGSAASTYNVRLCPLMLPALILIATVPLSTSSITSNPHSTYPSSSEENPSHRFSPPRRFTNVYAPLFCSKAGQNR